MNVRKDTARTIVVGPVLDADGVAKTDEAVASILASKNGGAAGALDGSATLAHINTGYYRLALTANDIDTLGCLELILNSGTNSMPIRALNVMTATAWDALHAASGGEIPADAVKVSGSSTGADNLEIAALAYSATRGLAGTALPNAAADAAGGLPVSDAGELDLDTLLARLDQQVSAAKTLTAAYDAAKTASQAGDAMTMTAGERTTLAAAIEAAIINELDGTAVMQAIADLIASDMNTGDLSVVAIATACRDAILDRVLAGNHDATGTTGKLLQYLSVILSDTDELQKDLTNGGRLDLLLDAIYLAVDTFIPGTLTTILSGLGSVKVGDIAQAALAKFLSTDTGETEAVAGSVGKIAQATGFSTHSAADVKMAMEAAGSSIAAILEDSGTTLPEAIANLATAAALTAAKTVIDAIHTEIRKVPREGETNTWTNTDTGVATTVEIS